MDTSFFDMDDLQVMAGQTGFCASGKAFSTINIPQLVPELSFPL